MNTIIVRIKYGVIDIRREMSCPNEEPKKEVIFDECRADYEPNNVSSANSAIDTLIESIIKEDGEFRRAAERFGYEIESGTVELIITREDGSTIASLDVNNSQELEMFQRIYQFLKENFYYV